MESAIKWPSKECREDAEFIESQLPDLRQTKQMCESERLPYWKLPEWQAKMGRVAEAVVRVAESLDFPTEVYLKPSSAYETLETFWRLICAYAVNYTEDDVVLGPWPSSQCRSDTLFVDLELNEHLPQLSRTLAARWGSDYIRRAEWRGTFAVVMCAIVRVAAATRCPCPPSLQDASLTMQLEALSSLWKHVRAHAPAS